MDSRIYMRTALNRTGIYDTENKNINAELSAYEEGIRLFTDDMERILDNCFIETADKENLLKRMKFFRSYINEEDIEILRAELFEKAQIRSSSLSDMQSRLAAAGIEGVISEEKLKANVSVNNYKNIEAETAEAELKRYLPVFIELTVTEI